MLLQLKEVLLLAKEFASASPESILLVVIALLGYYFFKSKEKSIKSFLNANLHAPLDIRESARLSSLINETLVQLIIITDADRVSLFQFHNGSQNLANIPFAKTSVTNEVCNIGIEPLFDLNQNIPIGMMTWWVTAVLDHNIEIHDIEDVFKEDRGIYEFLKGRRSRSVYAICLKDFKDNPLGFVMIEFMKRPKILDSLVLLKAKEISNQISGYFLGEKYYASK